jgi:hypothetical protein
MQTEICSSVQVQLFTGRGFRSRSRSGPLEVVSDSVRPSEGPWSDGTYRTYGTNRIIATAAPDYRPPPAPIEDDDEDEKTRLTRPLNSPSLLLRTTPCSGDQPDSYSFLGEWQSFSGAARDTSNAKK